MRGCVKRLRTSQSYAVESLADEIHTPELPILIIHILYLNLMT